MKKSRLKKYATLIARVGANIQKGQHVVIQAELDQPEFVHMLTEECYKAGASKVEVEWSYQPLTKTHVRYRTLKTLSTVENWEVEKLRHREQTLPAMIYLLSEDPDGLKGIRQKKHMQSYQARYRVIKPFRDRMDTHYPWCIAAVAGDAWAKKMFPNDRVSTAREKLWEAILATSRVDDDPIAAWDAHNRDLKARCDYLNSLGIESLEYNAANGTHLIVGMIPDAEFLGGGEFTQEGQFFNPNIPTEEVFITPMRGKAEGIVYSSRPLSYRGQLIDNFYLRFENGKVVESHAEQKDELLKQLLAMDDGAAYLGECALVPYDSPIRRSELLFYNTLFDENAACHLALGEGFRNCIKGFENYTLEECKQKGVNDSMIHEDFMIGTEDLSIDAHTRDGKTVPLFRNGNWAF